MLFENVIIGPIVSRRLGVSLGVNLLHDKAKICSFDCVYCECGFNFQNPESHQPSREEVKIALEDKLKELQAEGKHIDVITFAGNGEPTTHRGFAEIIDDTILLRDEYYPEAKISVLSNATMIGHERVFDALNKVDNNILKLDSAVENTAQLINQPCGRYSTAAVVEQLAKFHGNVIVQTLFLRGEFEGKVIDNTTEEEVAAYVAALKVIEPKEVMIYSLDRPTPAKKLVKVEKEELNEIGKKIEAAGFKVNIA